MNVRLLKEKRYPAAWVFCHPPLQPGTVVPVVPASNIPQAGDAIRYWVNTPDLEDDAYGIGLYDGDFEVVKSRERKTTDEFAIQGNYGQGWEDVSIEETRREASQCLRLYRENEPQYAHRLKVRRVPR